MKMSVVILDTDPLIESMVLDCVGESQADVEMVSETRAAKEFIDTQSASLVVVNADLPRGWRFCTELKKDATTANIPLMILSGKATDDVFHDHQKLPTRADAYLKKPIMMDQFRLAILAVLRGESLELEVDVDLGIETEENTEVNAVASLSVPDASLADPPPSSDPPALQPMAPMDDDLFGAHGADPFMASGPDALPASIESPIAEEPQREPEAADSAFEPPDVDFSFSDSIPPTTEQVDVQPIPEDPFVSAPSPPAPPSPPTGMALDSEVLTEISQERDLLKARVDELSQTGRALESAQKGQAQETELLRREVEALQAERDVLEDSKKRLTTELELSQKAQTDLRSALHSARQQSVGSSGDDSDYIVALETYIDQMNAVFAELNQKASRTDLELRQALATYQEREAALNQMRDSENRLMDTLLAVVEHVYEGLDLLRQDIHNGVPELPELGELPPPPEGVPSPLDSPALPPRPTRSATPSSLPNHSAPGTIEEQTVPSQDDDSYPNELPGLPQQDGALTTSADAPVISPAMEPDLPADDAPSSSLDLPLRAPFEAPSMDFDDLSNLEALVQKAPPTPSQDPSLNVAGAPLLDPGLMTELGVDPTTGQERDIPYES